MQKISPHDPHRAKPRVLSRVAPRPSPVRALTIGGLTVFGLMTLVARGEFSMGPVTNPRTIPTQFSTNSYLDTVDAKPGDKRCADAKNRCSLRAAIMESNALKGPQTITPQSRQLRFDHRWCGRI